MRNEADSTASRRLRDLALEFSAAILANLSAFLGTARWLRTLPRCRHATSTANPISHEIIKEDDEDDYAKIWGPICRRLEDGWSCATYRFPPGSDRFIGFGLENAKQFAVLTALTFDKDFDGAELGLAWTWEEPLDSVSQFEGRSWAWSKFTSFPGSESALLEFVEEASKVLRIKLPFLQHRVSEVVGADLDAQIGREERARVRAQAVERALAAIEQAAVDASAQDPALPDGGKQESIASEGMKGEQRGFLTPRDLAQAGGIPSASFETFRKKLERWRLRNPGSDRWQQVHERRRNEPLFLYKLDVLKELDRGEELSSEVSSDRPAVGK